MSFLFSTLQVLASWEPRGPEMLLRPGAEGEEEEAEDEEGASIMEEATAKEVNKLRDRGEDTA